MHVATILAFEDELEKLAFAPPKNEKKEKIKGNVYLEKTKLSVASRVARAYSRS